MDQPDFVAKIGEIQKNPQKINAYLTDPRMMQVL